MKVALCAIAKLENRYIKEWIDYHLSIGFDNIIIGDNNDIDGENICDVVDHEYLDKMIVQIYDARGKKGAQMDFYNFVYSEIGPEYDWMLFLDIDEYLILEKDKNVKKYLKRSCFKGYNCIKIHWEVMDDNDHLVYTGEPTLERFVHPADPIEMKWVVNGEKLEMNMFVKSFVKPNIPKVEWSNAPQLIPTDWNDIHLKICNNCGKMLVGRYIDDTIVKEIDYTLAKIRHFRTRTIEEYIESKCIRQWPIDGCNDQEFTKKYLNIGFFFTICKWTPAKYALARQIAQKHHIDIE